MNKTTQIVLIGIGVLLAAALMVGLGWLIGQRGFMQGSWAPGMMGYRSSNPYPQDWDGRPDAGSGDWLPQMGFRSPGRAGRFTPYSQENFRGLFQMYPGMMGRTFSGSQAVVEPPTIEQAQSAFENYLVTLENDDLTIHEIMIFEENAYAIIVEESTGMGAMELLLDSASMQVFPEYGPNRMWNLKYGMMGGGGFSGRGQCCGMGSVSSPQGDIPSNMAITADQAAGYAREYLDDAIPDASVVEEGMAFYGYYTFDYQVDGEMAGMLSVNGATGQVWLHSWHGDFIEELEFD